MALAIGSFADLLKAGEVVINVPPQSLGKVLPDGPFRDLKRRLCEPLPRPVGACLNTRIPGAGHRTASCGIGGERGRLLAMGEIIIERGLVDRRWLDSSA
jgi:hypothetical protein